MTEISKYRFSGHESFPCKSLWLKKGYDFIYNNNNFNSADAVVKLGVGKNMVAAIRYWMKAFGLTHNDELTKTANLLFNDVYGYDPYIEDTGTLWLLHYLLVSSGEATIYNLFFTRFQRERLFFERKNVLSFVKRFMLQLDNLSVYNENTIKKDINVLIQNYSLPDNTNSYEEYSPLLIELDLISSINSKQYSFNIEGKRSLPIELLLYAIIDQKGSDNSVNYETLQNIGLIFCLNDLELISMILSIQDHFSEYIRYSDTAGLRQVQFLKEIDLDSLLQAYYNK